MKRWSTHFLAVLFVAAMVVPMGRTVWAAEATPVHASIFEEQIYIENKKPAFLNAEGKSVVPFLYNGSVYIPLRTAGEWMGRDGVWDEAAGTITLSGGKESIYLDQHLDQGPPSTPEEAAQERRDRTDGFEVEMLPEVKIIVDGTERQFQNAKGERIYPALLRGEIYLPLRSVGTLCGKEVLWLPPLSVADMGLPCEGTGETEEACWNSFSSGSMIFLYDPCSEEQIGALRAYLTECEGLRAVLVERAADLGAVGLTDNQAALTVLADIRQAAFELQQLAKPDVAPFEDYYDWHIRYSASRMIERVDYFTAILSGEQKLPQGNDWEQHRQNAVSGVYQELRPMVARMMEAGHFFENMAGG